MNPAECRWGIEHEFSVVRDGATYCDFTNTTFEDFDQVIEKLPVYPSDYPMLRIGDLGIRRKRWYIEGLERFSETGDFLRLIPKGFEIRTPVCASLSEAVATLTHDFEAWKAAAKPYGFAAAPVSFNPFATEYVPEPPLNAWERAQQTSPEDLTDHMHMLTNGPDISFSHPAWSMEDIIDIGKKLTYYSPYIVPFSFSSPFYEGTSWGGLSRRTYYRTGKRPAALVFVDDERHLAPSAPSLTKIARIPEEIGRIEFKAFDAIADFSLYESLGILLLGIALDGTLPGRALTPDTALHQKAAVKGFEDESIRNECAAVLAAAQAALPPELATSLDRLRGMLDSRKVRPHAMLETFSRSGSIIAAIM